MSGCSFPEGLCTLRVTHHSIAQPSTASWQLASASRRLLGHVSHRARWLAPLMSKGSEDACTSSGIATFLLTAFHGTVCPAPSAGHAPRWCPLRCAPRGPQSGGAVVPAQTRASLGAGVLDTTG